MHPDTDQSPIFAWTARIAMVRSKVLLAQLSVAFGVPIFLLGALLLILEMPTTLEAIMDILSVLGIVCGIIGVLLIFVLIIVYQGGYDYHYVIDAQGIRATTTGRTAKTNRVINTLLMLSGRPTQMGAGALAAARQSEYIAWSDINNFSVEANARIINLKNGPLPTMVVACDKANYTAVLEFIQARVGEPQRE